MFAYATFYTKTHCVHVKILTRECDDSVSNCVIFLVKRVRVKENLHFN